MLHKVERKRQKTENEASENRAPSRKAQSPIQSSLGRDADRVGVLWHPKLPP